MSPISLMPAKNNMKPLFLCLTLLFFSFAPLSAQPAIPAQPADPNQARPAMPVEPAPVPAAPAASTATNLPAATAPQVAVAIIADSSLKQVLQELAQSWADSQDLGPQVPLTLTNAGTLRAKVEGGAGGSAWDVVISADVADVKEMTNSGLLFADGQCSLARNSLVVYGRKALIKDDDLDWFDLIGTEWKKVALGNPDLVASGRVARRALQKHDLLDDDHKDLYLYGMTDSLTMGRLLRGEADAIFVYKTDAARLNLHGFDTFPLTTDDAPPVFYTAAVCRLAKNPAQARAFIDYCASDAAKAIWAKYGFETN
jgi:molybdate transport system substrate-binding protein